MWLIWIAALMALPTGLPAMELKVVGNQLIVSGRVVGDEPERVREALAGYQTGQLLRERGLRTAVSGYCYSSCSRMFLGGSTRYFTDDYPAEDTHIGFHGHYHANGHLNAALVRQYGLRDWIIKYSDGKADAPLVERWINIPYSRGMIHFFRPWLIERGGSSTFICQGDEPTPLVFACEPVFKTALDLGVVTSLDIVRSADRGA